MTPVELRLDHADRMLTGSRPDGPWPRCAIWLIRIALERAVSAAWTARYPGPEIHQMRNQLLVLVKVVDNDTQYRIGVLWDALSRAGHHHHYELTPTTAEIRSWLDEARALIARLESTMTPTDQAVRSPAPPERTSVTH